MVILAAFFLALFSGVSPAHAQAIVYPNGVTQMCPGQGIAYPFTDESGAQCPGASIGIPNGAISICPGNGLVERLVTCITGTVRAAALRTLLPFSQVLGTTISTLCVLSIALFGYRVSVGRHYDIRRRFILKSDLIVYALKLGAVVWLTADVTPIFTTAAAAADTLVDAAGSYLKYSATLQCPFSQSLWQRVDCALDQVLGGILTGSALFSGLLGFIVASLFSGPVGFSIFITGIIFVLTLVRAMAKALYIYLSAYLAIMVLVIVSPLFIPLILFRNTKAYFEKWLRMLLGMILQPVFLVAYLTMSLTAFDVVVFTGPKSVYGQIAGAYSNSANFRIGDYLVASGAYVDKNQFANSLSMNSPEIGAGNGLRQTGGFGQLGQWAGDLKDEQSILQGNNLAAVTVTPAVDFAQLASIQGVPQQAYTIHLLLTMLIAAIVAYIFYTLLDIVPGLGQGLSSASMSMPEMSRFIDKGFSRFGDKVKQSGEQGQRAMQGGAPRRGGPG